MAHVIQKYVMLDKGHPWTTSGEPIETFCKKTEYTILNIRNEKHQPKVITKKELSNYRAFYVISANMDRWQTYPMQHEHKNHSQNKNNNTQPFVERATPQPIKIGVASNIIQRLKSYIVNYGEHSPNEPTKGARLHMLLLTKTPNEVCSSYQQSSVKQLEKHIIHYYKDDLAQCRGKERFNIVLDDICKHVVGSVGQSTQWMTKPTQTLKRVRRSNTITHASLSSRSQPSPPDTLTNKTIERSRTLPLVKSAHVGDCYIVRMYPRKHNLRKWNVVKLLYKRPDKTWGIQWMNVPPQPSKTKSKSKSKTKTRSSPRTTTTTKRRRLCEQPFYPSWVPIHGGDEVFQPSPPKQHVATYYELPSHRLISKPFHLTPDHHLPDSIQQWIRQTYRPQYQ